VQASICPATSLRTAESYPQSKPMDRRGGRTTGLADRADRVVNGRAEYKLLHGMQLILLKTLPVLLTIPVLKLESGLLC
jgi:hypothetical protein